MACLWTRCAGILVFASHGVYRMVVIKRLIQRGCYRAYIGSDLLLIRASSLFARMVCAFTYGF